MWDKYYVGKIVNTPDNECSNPSQGAIAGMDTGIGAEGETKYQVLLKPGTVFKSSYYDCATFSYLLWFTREELDKVN